MTYQIVLTDDDCRTIAWVGERYGWTTNLPTNAGIINMPEHEAWEWKDAVEGDMEGGHSIFPCLNHKSDLFDELLKLYQSIV